MARKIVTILSVIGFITLTEDSPLIVQALFGLIAVISGYPWVRAIMRGEFR